MTISGTRITLDCFRLPIITMKKPIVDVAPNPTPGRSVSEDASVQYKRNQICQDKPSDAVWHFVFFFLASLGLGIKSPSSR